MKRALFVLATLAVLSAPAMANEALAKAKNCMACHTVDKKLVGPSYKDVAAKFGKEAGAADMLAGKIIKGSVGTWGAIPMPPNANVSEAEAKTLATWILSLQ